MPSEEQLAIRFIERSVQLAAIRKREASYMTTKHSPLSALKAQADKIAASLKASERGEKIDIRFAEKIAARGKEGIKVGIVMDDKTIIIEMPWVTIRNTSEVGLSEYIIKLMRESRDDG